MRFFLVLVVVVALSEGADGQPSCGRVSGNVSSQDIPLGRWPWFAGLYFQGSFLCSGSLVSDQWVLTAATCFYRKDPSTMSTVLGRINQTVPNPNEVSRGINQTVCHPLFNRQTFDNNICLAKLSSPVELSDHISPVCLAAENSTFPNGTFSWIIGPFNDANQELTELQLQILGNNECKNRSRISMTDNMICTRDDPAGEQPCLFTSGAPLLIGNDDLVWIQLGIAVTVLICRKTTYPPVYTRVSRYQDWISNVTGSRQPGFVFFPSSGDVGVSTSTSSHPSTNPTTTILPPTPNIPTIGLPGTMFGSSEKLSSTVFTSVSALLFSLVVLIV